MLGSSEELPQHVTGPAHKRTHTTQNTKDKIQLTKINHLIGIKNFCKGLYKCLYYVPTEESAAYHNKSLVYHLMLCFCFC